MMSYDNQEKSLCDPLNESVPSNLIPMAFSTEIKKNTLPRDSSTTADRNYSFEFAPDKYDTFYNESVQKLKTPSCSSNVNVVPSMGANVLNDELNLSARYLEKHQRPVYKSISFSDMDNVIIGDKKPLKETNADQQHSDIITKFRTSPHSRKDGASSSILSSCEVDENSDTAGFILERGKELNLNETTLSGFDELFNDLTLSDSLNLTKIASVLKVSCSKKTRINQQCAVKEDNNVILLSNKSSLLWVGVPVQIGEIKSFTLLLKSSKPQEIQITIKKSTGCFYLTNQNGQSQSQSVTLTFEPKTEKKLYVAFHPTNSNYYTDVIVISVASRRFKINLFGYAEPAVVELKGFRHVADPINPEKECLMRSCQRTAGNNMLTVSVFNSGARTAFVALFSYQKNIIFQPRMFLLIPKTKMEFDITVTIDDDKQLHSFFMVNVDEELRRAARINVSELPSDDSFNIFHHLQIFARISEEKTIRQDDLPKFDWRPFLCRQINASFRLCYLDFDNTGMSGPLACTDRWTSDSVSTIGMLSKSSLTCRSALSNVECLYNKSVFVNSAESVFIPGRHQQQSLSPVVILREHNIFTPTCVGTSSYVGVLVRNHNQSPIDWRLSPMTSVSQRDEEGLLMSTVARSPSSNSDSVYSLTSIPIYDPTSSITALRLRGTLQANEAVLIPVRFRPENTGAIECRCTIHLSSSADDTVLDRSILFSGTGVRSCGGPAPEIPGLQVDPVYEDTIWLKDLLDSTVGGDGKAALRIAFRNRTKHRMQLFANKLQAPFDLRISSFEIEARASMLKVGFRAVAAGTFREVLVLCDEDGNSTFISLVVHVQ